MHSAQRAIFRRNLLVRRKAAGMKSHELAEKIGVARSTVSMWEKGHSAPAYLSRLKKVADTLGCTVDDLVRDKRRG